ncbi:MAG: hypothetical protein KBF43_00635 [Dermatophilaceae bacterium]|jgi:hypothetical protein|nr:hypothetical protein [Actinomycetales bacterium]MBP8882039.1 hypothetical protein [Dermatophilaceae bacterium]MBP9917079.1 hypothetical protein [Dermatophilaceae bacterium]
MNVDPRAALALLVSALERHLEVSADRRDPDDAAVIAAAEALAEAFDDYDEALFLATEVATPLAVYGDLDDDGTDDLDDDGVYAGLDDDDVVFDDADDDSADTSESDDDDDDEDDGDSDEEDDDEDDDEDEDDEDGR